LLAIFDGSDFGVITTKSGMMADADGLIVSHNHAADHWVWLNQPPASGRFCQGKMHPSGVLRMRRQLYAS
jgi:hypothetical protein